MDTTSNFKSMNRLSYVLICLALIFITILVYHDVANYDFANIDDQNYVFENTYVQQGFTLESLKWAFAPSSKENRTYWHPLTWLSHMLDCTLFGLDAGKHHLVSLGMHTVSTILLFLVFFQMTGALWKSAFVAALFALHPLNVESVAWIAERKNVLSAVFWMLSLMAYLYFTRSPNIARYFLLPLAFLCGLLSKPMLVTLPVILFLIDIWPLGRLTSRENFFRLINEKIPMLVLTCIIFIIVFMSLQTNDQVLEAKTVPMSIRFANAVVSAFKYMIKVCWPHPLAVYYPFPDDIPLWKTLGSFFVISAITVLSMIWVKTKPWFFAGWSWFLVAISPVSGVIQVGLWPEMADRFAYVPAIGLFVIIAWGWEAVSFKMPCRKAISAVLAIVILISFALLTRKQLSYWQNPRILFEHTLSVTRENPVAVFGYANGLEREGRTDQAVEKYYQVISLRHDYGPAHTNLGNILYKKKQFEKAVYHFNLVVRLQPESAKARLNLANAYAASGRYEDSLIHYEKALTIEPDNPLLHYNIGVAHYKLYQYDKAIDHFQTAIRLQPDYDSAQNALKMVQDIKS